MSNVTGIIRARQTAATEPAIYNVSVPLANTEVSQALSPSTKQFLIKVRGNATLKVAYTLGESGTNYITIPKGSVLVETGLDFTGTIYFQCDQASQTVEIREWT